MLQMHSAAGQLCTSASRRLVACHHGRLVACHHRAECSLLVWRDLAQRNFASPAAAREPLQTKLHPPGVAGTDLAIERFTGLVNRAIAAGEEVDVEVSGARTMTNTLRALALTQQTTAEFKAGWSSDGSDGPGKIRIRAQRGSKWEDFMQTDFSDLQRMFVRPDTKALNLARALAIAESKNGAVVAKAYTDSETAVMCLAKALATASNVHNHKPMVSVPNLVQHDEGEALYLYIRAANEDASTREEDTGPVGNFVAYPPGAKATTEHLNKFIGAVRDRLGSGSLVEMQARGAVACSNALQALCRARGDVAEFEVRWQKIDRGPAKARLAETEPAKDEAHEDVEGQTEDLSIHGLRFRATKGMSWSKFNKTDFSSNMKLVVAEGTNPQKLAQAIAAEAFKHDQGAVAVHCYFDNKAAVHNLGKALAYVPVVASGQRVMCVPSLKRLEDGTKHLRVFARLVKKKSSESSEP